MLCAHSAFPKCKYSLLWGPIRHSKPQRLEDEKLHDISDLEPVLRLKLPILYSKT